MFTALKTTIKHFKITNEGKNIGKSNCFLNEFVEWSQKKLVIQPIQPIQNLRLSQLALNLETNWKMDFIVQINAKKFEFYIF